MWKWVGGFNAVGLWTTVVALLVFLAGLWARSFHWQRKQEREEQELRERMDRLEWRAKSAALQRAKWLGKNRRIRPD